MAAPMTVRAAGVFRVMRGGVDVGDAVLRMSSKTKGSLSVGNDVWKLTGDPTKKKFKGQANGAKLELKIINRSKLKGAMDGNAVELERIVLPPISGAELTQSDSGPTGSMKSFMATLPDYEAEVGDSTTFWYEFGPVLYRGRLNGTARVLGIASDPGPAECLPFARRALVGDSGQKTQGFLAKLGLTKSYVLVNAFAVALHPGKSSKGRKVLANNAAIKQWRHGFYNRLLAGGSLEAVVAFGDSAHQAYDLWVAENPAAAAVPVVKIPHPAAVDRDGSGNDSALKKWKKAVTKLRGLVTPDPDGDPAGPNYGAYFTENDYVRIPRRDLPLKAPAYFGDDSWGRAATPQHNNCCKRPSPDDSVSLLLSPPPGQGLFLKYRYGGGKLIKTTKKNGATVATDACGIPL